MGVCCVSNFVEGIKIMGAKVNMLCFSLIILSLLFTAAGEAAIDPDTIAGLWLFDEGAGDETEDSSGNGYDGKLEGSPSWVDGRFEKALEFNGSNYVELLNSAPGLPFGGTSPFSITVWVKNMGGGVIIGKFNGGVIGAYVLSVSGTVNFHREVAPWGLAGTTPLPNGEFAHVAATYDGATMKIYVDAELDVEQDRLAQNTDLVTPVLIGARYTSGAPSSFFSGVLDEVALFNVALTEEQIEEAMAGLSPNLAVSAFGKMACTWGEIKGR